MTFTRNLFLAAALLSLTGCQTARPNASQVTVNLPSAESAQLSGDAANFLAQQLPAARTTLVLATGITGTIANTVSPAMIAALRSKGYGIAFSDPAPTPGTNAVRLRFLVSRMDNGVLLRLRYGSSDASRFYLRTTGQGLVAVSPFSVREGVQ